MRHYLALLLATALLACGMSPAGAQAADSTAFAPYVSKLRATVQESRIYLSWRDSPDVAGSYLVYRSTSEITDATLDRAQLVGTVAAGTGSFVDTPPDTQGYFYAVLVRDAGGKLYRILVPYRNRTSTAAAVASVAPEDELAATVTGIRAAALPDGSGIEVTFASSNPQRDLILLRGTAPIATAEDLLRSTSTTSLDAGATRHVDVGLPGVDYWFAVLDAGLFKVGKAQLAPNANVTSSPVRIPAAVNPSSETATLAAAPAAPDASTGAGTATAAAAAPAAPAAPDASTGAGTATTAAAAPAAPAVAPASPAATGPSTSAGGTPAAVRSISLPALSLGVAVDTGRQLSTEALPSIPPRREVSPAAAQAIALLLLDAVTTDVPVMKVQLLDVDEVPTSGEAGSLADIVEATLARGAYAEAEQRLQAFLGVRRNPDVEARARFYLGQAYWFQDRVREAMVEFLLCEDSLFRPTRAWQDACLLRLSQLP